MNADGTRQRAAVRIGALERGGVGRRGIVSALLKSLRLHQWVKNLVIFVPLILAGKFQSLEAWRACIIGFFAFGILASATYILNDLRDVRFDRLHWTKWARPLANGDLPVMPALAAVGAGVLLSLAIAAAIDFGAVLILLFYCALTLAYSFSLKRVPVLDAFILAALFTLRLVFGIYLAKVTASPWLLVFSMFLFMSLSLGKRYTEISRAVAFGRERIHGRGYFTSDGPLLFGLGLSTGVGAVLIMILYLLNEAFSAGFYKSPVLLWALPAALFLWLGRYWLLAGRGELADDPVEFAIKDIYSLSLGAAMAAIFVAAWQL
ncbi:MAG TPA: UbiA family prenyltransferase [Alphaproteobacteria bacterium]